MHNVLGYGYEGALPLSMLIEGETINEVLRTRRADLKNTPRAMSVAEMGNRLKQMFGPKLGRSGGWINTLELGTSGADIMTLQPEVRLALLRLYHFSDDEITHLNERFSLRLSPEVKNPTMEMPQTLDMMPGQTITGVGAGGFKDVNVANFAAAGRKLEDVIQVHAENNVYILRDIQITRGSYLYFDKQGDRLPGKTALYQVRGHERFVILPYSETIPEVYVTTFDGKEGMKLEHDDPPLELLGILYGVTTLEPKG